MLTQIVIFLPNLHTTPLAPLGHSSRDCGEKTGLRNNNRPYREQRGYTANTALGENGAAVLRENDGGKGFDSHAAQARRRHHF